MKKTLLFAAVALFGITTANAQSEYRPQGGEKNLEVLFAPLGGTPVSIFGIKARKFNSMTSAYRMGLFLGYGSESTYTSQDPELKDVTNTFNLTLQPGIEKHLTGTDRLSPYFGGVLDINYSSKTVNSDMAGGTDGTDFYTTKTKTGSFGIGVNGVAGVDYYFAKKIYVGTEVGFGIQYSKDLDKKVSSDAPGSTDTTTKQGGSFQVGPNVVGQIRLGWLFN